MSQKFIDMAIFGYAWGLAFFAAFMAYGQAVEALGIL